MVRVNTRWLRSGDSWRRSMLPTAALVDHVHERFATLEPAEVFGQDRPIEISRELRRRGVVGGNDQIRGCPQRVADWQRLGFRHVQTSAREMTFLERIHQR